MLGAIAIITVAVLALIVFEIRHKNQIIKEKTATFSAFIHCLTECLVIEDPVIRYKVISDQIDNVFSLDNFKSVCDNLSMASLLAALEESKETALHYAKEHFISLTNEAASIALDRKQVEIAISVLSDNFIDDAGWAEKFREILEQNGFELKNIQTARGFLEQEIVSSYLKHLNKR